MEQFNKHWEIPHLLISEEIFLNTHTNKDLLTGQDDEAVWQNESAGE